MSVADKLLQLNQVKQDIKTAIEEKGADLTGVAFSGYAEKIDEIETGGGSQGETWVINKSPIITDNKTFNISFESNNEQFNTFVLEYIPAPPPTSPARAIKYDSQLVYRIGTINAGWQGINYRAITFETEPTGDLLTWLQANAVKIGAVVELTQAQYDALSVYDNNTYYLIVEV